MADLPQQKLNLINTLRAYPQYISSCHTLFSTKVNYILLCLACFFTWSTAQGQPSGLFDSDEILEFTLRGDLKTAFKDRGEDPQYYKATLHYEENQTTYDIPLRIKTRGNFRKSIAGCKYPPLFLNFKKSATPENSVFKGQDKTKLVTPCVGDQYVIQEYLVYKLYNLITPLSFRARLVKVVFEDTVKEKFSDPYYSFLLEEEEQMAERNQLIAFERLHVKPEQTETELFLKMAVFQYMIGNTDWSIQYMQNFKFIGVDSTSIPKPIPYDFDHAGIVGAPYAKPAVELKMTSTRQRRYRGYCLPNMNELAPVFETFNQLKGEFNAIYRDNPLLSDGYKKQTLKFLDKFYETINDPKKASRDFLYPCDPNGTGNVIIKGLNTD